MCFQFFLEIMQASYTIYQALIAEPCLIPAGINGIGYTANGAECPPPWLMLEVVAAGVIKSSTLQHVSKRPLLARLRLGDAIGWSQPEPGREC
jgi:hypothetical protein